MGKYVAAGDAMERSPQWKHLLRSVKKEEKLKYKKKIKEEFKNAPDIGNLTLKMILIMQIGSTDGLIQK